MVKILKKEWFWLGMICLATVVVYGNSFQVPFLYDDTGQIVESAFIKNPGFLPKLFTSDYHQLSPKRYRPVTVIFYFLQYAFWRLNPWGYHLFKLLLHLINVVLLFCYLRLFQTGKVIPILAAAFFSLHPAQVETITCISFLDDPLMFLWFLLSCLIAIKATRSPDRPWHWYSASLIFYLLALASKELALILPFWMAIQFLAIGFRKISRKARFWAGYVALSLIWIVIRFHLMEKSGWTMAVETPLGRLYLVAATYIHYLRVASFPINLCPDYVYPLSSGVFGLPAIILFPLAIIIAIFVISSSSRNLFILLGWGWFILALLPLANIISQPRLAADRYLYLPLVGFCLVIAVLVEQLRKKFKKRLFRLLIWGGLFLILFWWGGLIGERNRIWSNPVLLWEDVLQVSPCSATAHNNLGSIYLGRNDLDSAEGEFKLALVDNPPKKFRAVIYTNLALVQFKRRILQEALKKLNDAIKDDPDYAPAYYELGNLYYLSGDGPAAYRQYQKALRIAPYDYIIYDRLAALSAARGEWDKAEIYAGKAVELNPDFAIGFDHLGVIYANQGRAKEARTQWKRALELNPRLESARRNLAAGE